MTMRFMIATTPMHQRSTELALLCSLGPCPQKVTPSRPHPQSPRLFKSPQGQFLINRWMRIQKCSKIMLKIHEGVAIKSGRGNVKGSGICPPLNIGQYMQNFSSFVLMNLKKTKREIVQHFPKVKVNKNIL